MEATKLIAFSFHDLQKCLGGVTVHLHHSTRTIQVQGSSIMPDKTRAALWFVNNFILTRFKDQAKAKSFAIKNTNAAFKSNPQSSKSNIASGSNNTCFLCNLIFITQSKPSRCNSCSNYFHKTTCLKDHMRFCHPNPQNRNVNLPSFDPPASGNILSSAIMTQAAAVPGLKTTLTFVPATSSRLTSTSSQAATFVSSLAPISTFSVAASGSLVPSVSASGSLVTSSASPSLSTTGLAALAGPSSSPPSQTDLNADAQPFTPGPTTIPKNTKRKNKTSVPVTAEQARTDFLQAELSSAQARIVQLDASVVDKDQRISVLMARLKLFEEKQNKDIYDKYFPANDNSQPIQPTTVPPPPCLSHCHPTHCPPHQTPPACSCSRHPPHPCLCHPPPHSQCSPAQSSSGNDVMDTIKALTNEVAQIAKNTELLKSLMKKLGHVPQPNANDAPFQTGANDATFEPLDELTAGQAGPSNESFSSIDEFITDIDLDPLNLQLPTSHP